MNLRKLAVMALFAMAPLGAMAVADLPEYTCLAGSRYIEVPLALVVSNPAKGAMFSGNFSVTAEDNDVALRQPVVAYLSLVKLKMGDSPMETLTLVARIGDQTQVVRSIDLDVTPNLVIMVPSAHGIASKVSIQCKTKAQWDLEAEITEGKIQATSGQ